MLLVHNERMESFLPEVATPVLAEIHAAGVAPVCFGDRPSQSVLVTRHHDEVDVVRHETVGQHGRFGAFTSILCKRKVGAVVVIAEEDRLASIAALGDVMGVIRDDESGHPGHRWYLRACVPWP
jgi:hypothetical protein